ncbi:MAG: hypothetical protein A2Z99_12610 [Treponema sp. GWB1_62_6]|nr:MAG: hypothetical protein A2001_05540 [Treponema sp. GWC1_61_84]OHE70437.1 MAG: hypothetical protein A2Z99_12610 [Treponema sp. GWB1_62_6]HCM27251.1 hypothetical protein [Treponema sp.]
MRDWEISFRRGLRRLSKHDPRAAVRDLSESVASCPVSSRHQLALAFYYLGIALERSGQCSLAVKSWVSARRLERTGALRRSYDRWVNEYGMRRRPTRDEDDFQAFRSIHVGRYLSKRGRGRFGSRAERDAVFDLIADAWKLVRKTGIPAKLPVSDRLALFRRCRVDLPFLYLEDALAPDEPPLVGDFRRGSARKRLVVDGDRCPCGSGLPYCRCCGRTRSCIEIESGSH